MVTDITYHPAHFSEDARFSIVIPTWNNLPYIRHCLDSLKKNSRYPHQIILHINEGSEGTLEWAKQSGHAFTHSPKNVGICFGVNAAASLAKTRYLVYLNDDMYVCPDWDAHLLDEIEKMEDDSWFMASTLIEAAGTGNPCVIGADYGKSLETFREDELLAGFTTHTMHDQQSPGGCANVVPLSLWRLVGGYSIEYTPGWNSDPDFAMKLWQAGVREFKTISKSRVYHFHNVTGKRVGPRKSGRKVFAAKWGLTSAKFMKHFLHHGEEYKGLLTEPAPSWELTFSKFRGRVLRPFL